MKMLLKVLMQNKLRGRKMKISNNYTAYSKSPAFGSAASSVGKMTELSLSKLGRMLEFDSFNMSFPTLVGVMTAGVAIPRLIQAQDEYDREEILRRDVVTIATLIMGAPAFHKLFSAMNENKSGFVLADKRAEQAELGFGKKLLNAFIPGEGRQVYSSNQIISKYSDLGKYNKGLVGFCEFIDAGKGNLAKLFSIDDNVDKALKTIMKDEYKDADNKTIIKAIEDAVNNGSLKKAVENIYQAFSKNDNAFVKKAKTMNSTFNFLATFLLVPALLGFGIPKVNEYITKKKFKANKAAAAAEKAKQSQQQAPSQPFNNLYFMTSKTTTKVFDSFKKA